MISRNKAPEFRFTILIVLSATVSLLMPFSRAPLSHAYFYSPFPSPWSRAPFFNPMNSRGVPPQSLYPGFLQFNANYSFPRYSSSYSNIGRGGFAGYGPYGFPRMSSGPFYVPAYSASLNMILNGSGNQGLMDTYYFQPDPQWRTGKEATPSPPPTPGLGPGIDTGEIRVMPPAQQRAGISYTPGIPGYIGGQLIVMFRPNVPAQERESVFRRHNCSHLRTSSYGGFTLVALPTFQSVRDAAREIALEPSVLYAEPNYYRYAHLIPNDPYYNYQWHLPHMYTNLAWDLSSGTGVVVGLLDSGVSYRNAAPYALAPDLAGTLITPGWDFVNADANPDDDYGHGTHMCGCIAQTTNNFLGVAGVAYASTVMAVKVMDSLGDVGVVDEADGIYYATNNGAKIINLSLGGPGISITEQNAVIYAYGQGVTLLASSGNAGSSVLEYPASYTECISVGAVQYDRTRPSYSNYGTALDVMAPGGNITLDQNFDSYADGIMQQTHDGTTFSTFYYYLIEGTSPACALASGVAALVVSKSTAILSPLQVRNILEDTAIDLGVAGWDQYYGWGEIDAYAAVSATP